MDCDTIYNGATADGVKAITDALELSAYEHKKWCLSRCKQAADR